MRLELERALIEKYAAQFSAPELGPKNSLTCFGCEHGDGWYDIVSTACKLIAAHLEQHPQPFMWTQIKEKFGALRLYYYGGDEYIAGVIAMSETLSCLVCERCGNRGQRRGTGWLYTLCDTCEDLRANGVATSN